MLKLTTFERIRIVNLFNKLPCNTKNKYSITTQNAANKYGIYIPARGISKLIEKWMQTKSEADIPRNNKCKSLITGAGILSGRKTLPSPEKIKIKFFVDNCWAIFNTKYGKLIVNS